jgi:hypothetical protein
MLLVRTRSVWILVLTHIPCYIHGHVCYLGGSPSLYPCVIVPGVLLLRADAAAA